MNKTDLINILFERHKDLSFKDSKIMVNLIIKNINKAVATGNGVEVRGFGSFTRKTRAAYVGTHPRTMKKTMVSKKYIPFFKAGKILREEVKKINKS